MQDGEGPEDLVEDVLRTKYLEALCIEGLVLAQPVDLPQVELNCALSSGDVFDPHELQNVRD